MSLLKKSTTPPPLDNLASRVAAFREELDQFIDRKAEELKSTTPGVPVGVLRNILTNRSFGCQCQAALNILEQDT
jgi:hypothetical protein